MILTLAVGAAALLAPLAQDTTVAVSPGTRLELTTHTGAITVRTWNRNSVQVSTDFSDEEALRVEVSGGVVEVHRSNRYHDDDDDSDYRLTVPTWMAMELSTVEGDVRIEGSQARVTASSVEGTVTVRGGKEFVSANSVEGDITVEGVIGRVEVNSVDGSVMVRDVTGALYAESVDGNIDLDGIQSSDVEANTVDGNISYHGSVERTGRYRLTSHDGDVTLETTELHANISVSTFDGDFESCGHEVTITGRQGANKKRFKATVGGGGAQIDLESFDGNIYLVKPGCR
jgi:DUF4097 and DUF4098 domain-containing protein YvlB